MVPTLLLFLQKQGATPLGCGGMGVRWGGQLTQAGMWGQARLRDGDQLSSTGLKRAQGEMAVTVAGAMEVRCRDGLPDGDREQVAGVVTMAESGCLSLLGTIGALNPAGSWV